MARMVRWGVIGAGGIARRRTIPEGINDSRYASLTAVQDIAPGVAEEVAGEYRNVKAYENEDDLLGDGDVEAVYIATPAHLHRPQVEKAIKAGKHVLVEKPLAANLKDAQALVRLARRYDAYCTEGYMMKFHPMHEKAHRAVANGAMGKVVMARGQLSCWFPPMKNVWRLDPEKGGGGSLMDMGTHCFDLLQYVVGSDITHVSAFCDNIIHKYPVEDSAAVLCKFRNGAHGIVEAYFSVRDEACLRRFELYGTEGGILSDGTIGQGGGEMQMNVLGPPGGYDADQKRSTEAGYQPVEVGNYNMYRGEVDYLSKCIQKQTPPEKNTLKEGLQVLKVAFAAYESAKTGQTVKV